MKLALSRTRRIHVNGVSGACVCATALLSSGLGSMASALMHADLFRLEIKTRPSLREHQPLLAVQHAVRNVKLNLLNRHVLSFRTFESSPQTTRSSSVLLQKRGNDEGLGFLGQTRPRSGMLTD